MLSIKTHARFHTLYWYSSLFHEHWLAFDLVCKTKKHKTTTIFNEFHATIDSCLVHTISKNAIQGGTIIVFKIHIHHGQLS